MTAPNSTEWLGTVTLMGGMFFLPLGYDVLFLNLMKLTGSYWITDFIFYCLSALFFILHYSFSRKILLMLGTFFLPFGYDFLFKTILDYTGSYVITDSVFYITSFVLFIIHFTINKTNPLDEIQKRTLETKLKIMDFKSKI